MQFAVARITPKRTGWTGCDLVSVVLQILDSHERFYGNRLTSCPSCPVS